MIKPVTSFFIILFLCVFIYGCADPFDTGSQNSNSSDGAGEAKNDPTKACYLGPLRDYKTCLPTLRTALLSKSKTTADKYRYQDPFTAEDFPVSQNPDQYLQPLRFLHLSRIQQFDKIAPNFSTDEYVRFDRDEFGIVSAALVDFLQQVRDLAGEALLITSGYRSPEFNNGLPGSAKWSRHQYGDAIDMQPADISLEELIQHCKDSGASFYQLYTSHVHCDWRNQPLDTSFFPTPVNIPKRQTLNVAISYEQYLKINKFSNKDSTIEFFVPNVPQEDSGQLLYAWTVFKKNGEEIKFTSPKLILNNLKDILKIQVTIGGSLKLTHNLPGS